jgi:hypothetical protein
MSSEHDGSIQKCRTEGPQRFACLCNVMYKKCGNLGMFKSVCDEVLLNLRNSFTVMRWCSFKHTLAQNNLCEFWCGMHLTCRDIPIRPGSVKRPEKVSEVTIAKAYARRNELEADPSLWNKPNRSHLDRLRKPYRFKATSNGNSNVQNELKKSTCRFLA